MTMQDKSDNGRTSIAYLVDTAEVQTIIAQPRRVPRKIRKATAEILAEELLQGYEVRDHEAFIKKYGILLNVLFLLRNEPQWQRIKEIGEGNELLPLIIMRMVLPQVLDIMESTVPLKEEDPEDFDRNFKVDDDSWEDQIQEVGSEDDVDKEEAVFDEKLRDTLKGMLDEVNLSLEADIKAIELLSMLFPGQGFDYSVRELHREFLHNLEDYAEIVNRNDDLARIVEILGRMESELGTRKLSKQSTGHSEIHSLRLSDDLHRMLPVELVNLADPELELLFFSKFCERKLMTYQLRGKDFSSGPPRDQRKGPVVALVDTSGSMFGEPEVIAKAVVLAITRRMIPEKREVKVILFSTDTTEITLTEKKSMGKEFLNFLSYSFGGGTDFNVALREGIRSLREGVWQGADLMFVSDGYSVVNNPVFMREWNDLKAANDARVYSIIINNKDAGGLEEISDHVYILDEEALWGKGGEYVRMIKDII